MSTTPSSSSNISPKWAPIGRIERRVLGVLVEKAKTTPDAYPMTLNGLTTGCNQKNNRDPLMSLEPDQVENALERLRHVSAVIEVAGSGRVPKYRHLMYEWMGIDKQEAAVMTELLLRGTQSVGELRARAARMEPIADVQTLAPILQNLIEKRLVISLSPPGRGQVVTHGLYLPEEMDKIRANATAWINAQAADDSDSTSSTPPRAALTPHASASSPVPPRAPAGPPTTTTASTPVANAELDQLRNEMAQLRAEVTRLRSDLDDLWKSLQ